MSEHCTLWHPAIPQNTDEQNFWKKHTNPKETPKLQPSDQIENMVNLISNRFGEFDQSF